MLETNRTNTILYCRLWDECVLFYKRILKLDVSFENDWFVEFQLNESTFLSIADSARASIDDVAGQGITLSWQTSDLVSAQQQLTSAGVATSDIQNKWKARLFYFRDPEGHRIELWKPIESSPITVCDLDTSVPDWLIDHPSLFSLFKELRIDYCCGGKSLESACHEQNLDPVKIHDQVLKSLG